MLISIVFVLCVFNHTTSIYEVVLNIQRISQYKVVNLNDRIIKTTVQ